MEAQPAPTAVSAHPERVAFPLSPDRVAFPLTEARFVYERAIRRAQRLENSLYEKNELKLNGITREIDHERRRFQSRIEHHRLRDEIYAINEMMRQRERHRFEDYVLSTQMSEAQADAMRLDEPLETASAEGAPDASAAVANAPSADLDLSEPRGRGLALDRWAIAAAALTRLVSDVVEVIDAYRPPTRAEIEALERAAAEASRAEKIERALAAALEETIEAAVDEALEEAALDVGAEHVLTANGIGTERELSPSEVYAVAVQRAQQEFDKVTRAYHRAERCRLAKEREEVRAIALTRRSVEMLAVATSRSKTSKMSGASGPFCSSSPYAA